MNPHNIILIGFMGTGKTTVGRRLADRTGWSFVDVDEYIVETEQRPISDMFARDGEERFRAIETAALQTLLAGEGKIVSTGGGAVLREENRRLMKQRGLVVALKASKQTIMARLRHDRSRPLLAGNLEERVNKLLAERATAYDFADLILQTDGHPPDELATAIIQRMKQVGMG